jgi:hypothetical protein
MEVWKAPWPKDWKRPKEFWPRQKNKRKKAISRGFIRLDDPTGDIIYQQVAEKIPKADFPPTFF